MHVRKLHAILALDIFFFWLKFRYTEGPFILQPWKTISSFSSHLLPAPSAPVSIHTKLRLLSCDQSVSGQFSGVCSSPVTAEAKHCNSEAALPHGLSYWYIWISSFCSLKSATVVSVVQRPVRQWRLKRFTLKCQKYDICNMNI